MGYKSSRNALVRGQTGFRHNDIIFQKEYTFPLTSKNKKTFIFR